MARKELVFYVCNKVFNQEPPKRVAGQLTKRKMRLASASDPEPSGNRVLYKANLIRELAAELYSLGRLKTFNKGLLCRGFRSTLNLSLNQSFRSPSIKALSQEVPQPKETPIDPNERS